MKLTFSYVPVPDLAPALAFYRDVLGLREAWREGTTTVAFQLPDTEVQVMVDQVEGDVRPGPAFLVDSVKEFRESYRGRLSFSGESEEIPGGYITTFHDPAGNPIYVLDQSNT